MLAGSACISLSHCGFDQAMLRSERTGWVGCCGVAGQQERLTSATPKIFSAVIATSARFRHPRFSAEALKRILIPARSTAGLFPYVLESHLRQHFRRMARQNFA